MPWRLQNVKRNLPGGCYFQWNIKSEGYKMSVMSSNLYTKGNRSFWSPGPPLQLSAFSEGLKWQVWVTPNGTCNSPSAGCIAHSSVFLWGDSPVVLPGEEPLQGWWRLLPWSFCGAGWERLCEERDTGTFCMGKACLWACEFAAIG